MKRYLQLMIVLAAYAFAQDDILPEPSQNPDAAYRLFRTRNIYTLLRLDTRTGMVWTVQWSLKDSERFVYSLSETPVLPNGKKPGRFTLFPTKNMYTFVMLDQEGGRTWHIQWSSEVKDRLTTPIVDRFLPEPAATESAPPAASQASNQSAGKRPIRPELGEWGHENETFEQFEKRRDAYVEALTDFKVREAISAERAKVKQPTGSFSPATKKKATPPPPKQ